MEGAEAEAEAVAWDQRLKEKKRNDGELAVSAKHGEDKNTLKFRLRPASEVKLIQKRFGLEVD